MIKKLKAFTLQMIAGANIATIIIMLAVGYSDRLNPVSFPLLCNAGLTFPIFLIINFGFLVFWLIFKMRGALIPFLGFLICYVPIRKYCPMNISHEPPAGAIKILSYNVWYFAGWEDQPGEPNPILEYIKDQNADIVCLQESATNEVGQNKIDSILNPIYQYRDTAQRSKGDCISIFSKYPILSKEHIDYESKGNISAAFKLMIDGTEVLVINNHLESTGLSADDKHQFKTMLKGDMKVDTAEMTSKLLIRKLAKATVTRAPEAEAVARYMAYHRNMPIIVCGDFNDSPISYAHRTIGKDLTDCYIETAFGPGISYHHNGFYVRIDNIMCSSDFEPYACRVDNSIKASDHYPIMCWLKKRSKSSKNE
ncbi:MAG: endonuclease/exonuclease/phosphatase family protein [Prevotella sp.]|nr:endonuclease/exonuclease/phosphatase family protein [Prevotella sp.]